MVQVSAQFANGFVDMTNPNLVDFSSAMSISSDRFAWSTPWNLAAVEIGGSGFTYSADSELTGGSIERIDVNVGNDSGVELSITGTGALIGSNIDKDDPSSFWNEVLKGDDSFDLSALTGTNFIFADDMLSKIGTDFGGNDTIAGGGAGNFNLAGDVYHLKGIVLLGETFTSTYHGGDDRITSGGTTWNILIGDASHVFEFGILYGGQDTLDNRSSTYEDSLVTGDAYHQHNGKVVGGDDNIKIGTGHQVAAGDVARLDAGLLTAGNDTITGSSDSDVLAGEVYDRRSDTAKIRGGDDVLKGGDGDDFLYGEVRQQLNHPNLPNVSGGNDTIYGGAGHDEILGQTGNDVIQGGGGNDFLLGGSGSDSVSGGAGNDVVWGELGNDVLAGGGGDDIVSGLYGADRLNGGKGSDEVFGYAGADRLTGGSGDDDLSGGGGSDIFIFAPGSGDDRITDFADNDTSRDDRIDVSAYGITKVGQMTKLAVGDDLIVGFSPGNTVVLVDYLVDHIASDLKGSDFIFA